MIGLVAMLLPIFSGAQAPLVKALHIGDTVPDITLTNVYNYPSSTITLSDLKGKLVILDFWATWCSACIRNFPKMESLQEEFGNKIQVLAVAYQDRKKVTDFFTSKAGQKYHVSSIVNDTILSKLFPHTGIPHCVWIGSDGIVKTITGAEEVTAANIQKLISQKQIQVQVKRDLDANKPLFVPDNFPVINGMLHYSILSKGWYSGLPSGNHLRKKGDVIIGQAVTNSNLLWIYKTAAINLFSRLKESFYDKRMILEVKDPSKITLNLSGNGDGLYDNSNAYNYDLIVPVEEADMLYSYMLQDLNRYTAYFGKIEKRKVKCFVLIKTGKEDKIKTQGGKPTNTLFTRPPYQIHNYPIANFISILNDEQSVPLPVIDGTNYKNNIDIQLNKITDIPSLRKQLQQYGLDLLEEVRPIYMFILSDKKSAS
jgi:thiol-disulfide isomerase/thioredoxin